VIIGHADRIASRLDLTADLRAGAQAIYRAARVQAQLVSDLLDVSRIVSGKLTLDSSPVELAAVFDHATETVRTAAHAKASEIGIDLDPAAPVVIGDAGRLQQVLWNLLANSVKFTPAGGRILVSSVAHARTVEIVINDTGQGIDPEFLPFVFDRFRQQDGTSTRRHGGLGLGLAIVRHVVEAHGGTVTVTSEGPGKGARFVVTLPRPAVTVAALRPFNVKTDATAPTSFVTSPPAVDGPPLSGVRVAFVDDDDDARLLVGRILRQAGAEVVTAGATRELYSLLRDQPCHVLLCDIGMPDQDGYVVIASLRRDERERARDRLPAAALTAYSNPGDRERAMAAGFDGFLTKPFVAARLIELVGRLASRAT
jgi:CheY-like chemotaxis protein